MTKCRACGAEVYRKGVAVKEKAEMPEPARQEVLFEN
jgi:hypothetical protein